ncbi:hypothetical protein CRG98_004871 [Punica granatum]|uniref:DUF659 domain-containing protein n=1 Tax=Punica granatum TaxID=22663 RepID=A0A2I0L231_PUNGR|nr:hypothetical protein CRG98_004871 [Punica granatum]
MINEIVEQVGKENVVQIVTDNAANYKATGEMLMKKRKKLFWTPYAAHCIDLMLEDLEKKIKAAYPLIRVLCMVDLDEKPAMSFIYNEMEKAKQKIKANFKDDRKRADREVMRGLYKVMDMMLDDEEGDKHATVDDLELPEEDEFDTLYGLSKGRQRILQTSRHNFNLRALGCGDDGDEESGGSQIGNEDVENMRTQQYATVDDLELPEEDDFDTLYDDNVGNDEDLDEI